ncbi:MAG: hypothetical protein C0467_15135 [Planctomycetaceae bacterium]|nr:hypothetical protein [Planctomycetaceae bacterium]
MKTIALFGLTLGMLGCLGLTAGAEDKKKEAADPLKLEGKYTLVSGKKSGTAIDEEAKKSKISFAGDKITIEGMGIKFVMGYKVDDKATPMTIDMEILEGPEGTKGAKALGIIEVKEDVVKLAYSIDKEKRPKTFEGKDGFLFELKKAK